MELAEKLERIQATSVMALTYLLQELPLKDLATHEDTYTTLLRSSRLWKLSKATKPLVHVSRIACVRVCVCA